ncbi:8-oxo-dGTP diphosphatase [Amnibacterium flavum]|uniref:8-oxo-dGTP diphosphatase n=1 Tax=Amnibacterium flavum TaxID=2173173 RepID=UPI001F0CD1C7|nr:8-oxo-dGTP diphosphatase [Amnibacterium flavum]
MFEVAVTYLLRSTDSGVEVLLGEKLTGIGRGKVVGPGGKLEPGESAVAAAVREVSEEVGLTVGEADARPIARLEYSFPHRPEWSQASTAFVATRWSGEPRSSRELSPVWFPIGALPLERMWADARLWLPRALAGEFVRGECSYGEDNDSVADWREIASPR